jgi:hypothetical protein
MPKILVVQMGHCYRKTGATGTTGEQGYATAVADACVRLLHGRSGWVVRKILADDDLADYRGDAFAAIHCDGSDNSGARGASAGYRNREGQLFAQAWKRAYQARGWTGGFRPDNYTAALQGYYGTGYAIAQGNERAFIAECGFMTSPADRKLLTDPGGPERVALALGDALGITIPQEDDMEADTKIRPQDWASKPGTYGWLLEHYRQQFAAVRSMVDTLEPGQAAILKAIAADRDIDEDRLLAEMRQAQLDTADSVAAKVIAAQRALLAEAVADIVPEEQADQILARLGEKLSA